MALDLVGVTEIADMFGVSRQRADQFTDMDGFPAPASVISAGRIWLRDDVKDWGRRTGRLTETPPPDDPL